MGPELGRINGEEECVIFPQEGHLLHLSYLRDLKVGGDTGGDPVNGILIYQGLVLIF